ncbi:MAG: sodium/solute symporter [Bacteroidetes bacterium]|jgi:solute:Na+ symporter, SSS family|nr:sodium/solute symporter [Bacteroidota bacterium]MBT3749644.1 sodium/solute symporter [Bacteroidota bacterium]MBT4397963.1 sodium/solute symporter [Bacteroidota bacterium]MBT4410946.1 sodium/solute symporter [Bacteroidota bacterium]MBT7095132.1 sodium/solute symporter [Bacteroidota bacterium]
MLTGIDYFIVIAYIIGILILGYYFKRFVNTSEDYFLGGRSLPFWAIGMSIVVSDIGALDFVGVSGQAYRYGISVGNFDWIGSVPAMLLAAFIFIPYFWRGGMYTIPEYLGRRYNSSVRTIASLTWIIFFAVDLGVLFWASAVLLNVLMGWPIWMSIMITAGVVGLYTYFGGITAVVMTDVVQMVIMFVGGLTLTFLGLHAVGGFDVLVDKITTMGPEYRSHFDLIQSSDTKTPFPWTGILFGLTFVMANAYMIGNQSIVQRCLTAKNEWHAKASMVFASGLKMLIPILVLFPGLMAIIIHPGLEDGDQSLPMMIKSILPPGLIGLVFAAFFAGLMSSVDSILNSTATLFTKDIYEPFIKKGASDVHYLKVGKLTTLVLLIIGVATSPISSKFPGIYVAVQTFLSFFQGPLFAILLLGIFWKRTTQWGGLSGIIIGIGFATVLNLFKGEFFTIEDPFLYVSWWSFLVGFIVTVTVSLITPRHSDLKLEGLVYKRFGKKDK